MVEGFSLRKSTEYCGISLKTAFFWRHKILDVLNQKLKRIKIKSVVEAADIFVRESYKGNSLQTENLTKMVTPTVKYQLEAILKLQR